MSVMELPPSTDSVPRARSFVRAELSGASVDVDTAVLLASEVVTNAVLHARTAVTLDVSLRGQVARVEVGDGSPAVPRVHRFAASAATGRGLRLVAQLASRWGVLPARGGKVVWFEVGPPSEDAWTGIGEDWLAEGAFRDG